jgi:hypothetical protein
MQGRTGCEASVSQQLQGGRSPRDAANQKLMEELVQKTNRQAVAVHNEDKIGICMTIYKRTITS